MLHGVAGAALAGTESADYESIWVTTRSGCRLHVRKWGAGKRGCVLVHGHGEASYVWNRFVPYLRGFPVFAIDLAGHGDSEWEPGGKYSIARYVQDVLTAMASFDLSDVRLVGHSLGANIAIRVAESSNCVSRLGVVDFGPRIDVAVRQHARDQYRSQIRPYAQISEYAALLSSMRPMLLPDTVAEIAGAMLRKRPDGAFELKCDPALALEENNIESGDAEILAILGRIRCPTLVVRGSGSAVLSPVSARMVASSIREARVCTIPNAGHAVMHDNPEDFGIAMSQFLHSG
jgi:pimeloyl-ACP methyl ester carboxylesterase